MTNRLLMNPNELEKWRELLAADDWSNKVWESVIFSSTCGLLWLLCISALVICLVPPLRRKVHDGTNVYLHWQWSLGIFIATNIVGILGWPVIFSVGVIAYWINTLVPASILEPVAQFFTYLSFTGWLTI